MLAQPYLRNEKQQTGKIIVLAAATAAILLPAALFATGQTGAPALTLSGKPPAMGSLPLQFEQNQGQAVSAVRYVARTGGNAIFFTPSEVALSLRNAETAAGIKMQFMGANAQASITGGDSLPGKVNYILGNDPAQWRTNVPTFGDIEYTGLYNGIDLQYEGTGGQLKGTYTVAPNADPNNIQWRYSGANGVQVDPTGNLQIGAGKASITEAAPVAWQDINGQRVPVAAFYKVAANSTVSFGLGKYDPNHELVIDPTITFGTFIGTTGSDDATGAGVDSAGNMYVSGTARASGLPLVNNLFVYGGGPDFFAAKFSADGTQTLYSTYIGGSFDENAFDMAVDSAGNAYITGSSTSTNFPTTANAFDNTNNGGDAVLVKLSPDGQQLLYSTFYGGSSLERGRGIDADDAGMAVITGDTTSDNLPLVNEAQSTRGGDRDLYIAKLDTTLSGINSMVFSTYLGGSGAEDYNQVRGNVAMNADGDVSVATSTFSNDFPTTKGAYDQLFAGGGNPDAAVAKFNTAGFLLWSSYLGATGSDSAHTLELDDAGDTYVVGTTGSTTNFPTTDGAYNRTCPSGPVFVTKFNSDGNGLVWSTCVHYAAPFGAKVDTAGNLYVTGNTRSTTFPMVDPIQNTHIGFEDTFLFKLNATGSGLLYSTYLTGSTGDGGTNASSNGNDLALDNNSNVYLAGVTNSADFPVQSSRYPYQGDGDGYLLRIFEPAPAPTATPLPSATPDPCQAVSFSDVPQGSTFYTWVRCLACRGILGGYADGTFRPNANVTRGQLAKIVANSAGFNENVSGQTFTDVPPTETFYVFIERAASRGIIGGYADGTFRPNANATRGQISKIVSNAAGFNEPVSGQRFIDVPPTHTFYQFIERIASRNIIGGYTDGTFRPEANATRGQVSKIVAGTFFPQCNTR